MSKLILIANRLPVTIEKKENSLIFNPSVGGLATGMSGLTKIMDCVWLGFSGQPFDVLETADREIISEKLKTEFHSYPVELNTQDIKLYYDGFSNKTIWPLFHYFPVYTNYDKITWESYQLVNEKFLKKLMEIIEPDDMVWIHDYQLMLLPQLIRKFNQSVRIGFFLHIPFPSYEIFRLLPWRKEILEGILGADLIGFHTYSYTWHFLYTVQRILGCENKFGYLTIGNRMINTDAFPMGIDYEKYADSLNRPQTKQEIQRIQKNVAFRKVILSIDRLDYTKGIIERLEAFDLFLEKNPQWREKVVLIMVAVPSRTKVDTYDKLKSRVDSLIGRINGKYDTIGWSPVRYIYRSLNFSTLTALYSMADVALITPLRDGMNLVAKEYIAARAKKNGVLILSEMAGVAEELGEALIVNPFNREEMAEVLRKSLSMPNQEQVERMTLMQERIKRKNVFKWANDFILKLQEIKQMQMSAAPSPIRPEDQEKLIEAFQNSEMKLIILDYDGTLVPFKDNPNDAKPDRELMTIIKSFIQKSFFKILNRDKNFFGALRSLIEKSNTEIAIVSGRSKEFLEKWFKNINITLAAEHGAWIKERNSDWQETAVLTTEWKKEIRPLLELCQDRTPGSYIEDKDYSMAWHYRKANAKTASERARELKSTLLNVIANLNLTILEGNKVIEIKSSEVSKGKAVNHLLQQKSFDFVLAIGDDATDEDMFASLPQSAYSIKVGNTNSKAKYCLEAYSEVRQLLKDMVE